jgi:hypothetical protein
LFIGQADFCAAGSARAVCAHRISLVIGDSVGRRSRGSARL